MAKTIALILGILFLIAGILGLFPNPIIGDAGLFHADMVLNIIHLLTGLIFLLVVSKSPSNSALTMKVFGIIYIIIAIIGFFVGEGELLGFVANNSADNWLHLILGIIILIAGFSAKDSSSIQVL